ncbi:MAG: amidohydrolase family protein [Deltaproteobacteria bacterium]|nr:amidohydrolase family protein [Deltaproteobacteria bacterium]
MWWIVACAEEPVPERDCGGTLYAGAVVVDAVSRHEMAQVCVEGEVIAWVEANEAVPGGAVDLSGRFLAPGLVESHAHLAHSGATVLVDDTLEFNLRAQLYFGVTTVVDVGGPVSLFDLRDRLLGPSPRVVASGPFLTAEGSHPCETMPNPDLCTLTDTGEEAAALVDAGADVLKVALADAAFSPWGATPRLDLDALDTIAAQGVPVLAHVDTDQDAIDALAHGADLLAHPPFAGAVGPEALEAARGARAVHSTVSAFAGVAELGSADLDAMVVPEAVRENWAYVQAHPEVLVEGWAAASAGWAGNARTNLAAMGEAGVAIVPGSDAGYYFVPHGQGLHRELAELEALGWGGEAILEAATLTPREALDLPGGRVEAGEPADLLVLGADPREGAAAWAEIETVIVRGEAHARASLHPDAATGTILSPAADGACLSHEDCASGACEGLSHACAESCPEPWSVVNDCGAEAWCMPADGASDPRGACREEDTCDLYAQDCTPAYYGMACIPYDEDTNACWYGGPRVAGEACDTTAAETSCAPGLYCSPVTSRCYALCDGECEVGSCHAVDRSDGSRWFGLCY